MLSDSWPFKSHNVTYCRAAECDYQRILSVAEPFYPDSPLANGSNGFLNHPFTTDMLSAMNTHLGMLIAKNVDDEVLGFLGLAPFSTISSSPVVTAMQHTLLHIRYHERSISDQKPFIFGPICVASPARGLGIFKGLYQSMWNFLPESAYLSGFAFIDRRNQHSLDAHVKGLGAEIVAEFSEKLSSFWVIAYSRPQ